jgi:site-specific DNA-methyltransferase (adenine-specific)
MRAKKGMNRGEKWEKEWFGTDNLSSLGFMFFMRGILLATYQKLKVGGHIYCFIDWRNYPLLFQIMESAGFRVNNMIVWDKVHFGMGTNFRNQHELILFASKGMPKPCNNRGLGNVMSVKRTRSDVHPTEKPLELIAELIKTSSANNDTVYDPFMGSGTTARACMDLGRNYIGSEISAEYCKIAESRLRQDVLL